MYPVLSVRMQTGLAPQLILAGQLLHASLAELDDLIAKELQANPALELAPTGATGSRRAGGAPIDWQALDERLAAPRSIQDALVEQAAWLVEPADLELARQVIYALNDDGYVPRPALVELAARLEVEPARLERVRLALHELEPPGLAACDLRERLLIQCAALAPGEAACELSQRILAAAWDDFAARRWGKIARALQVRRADVHAAISFIAHNLCPHPLGMVTGDAARSGLAYPFADLIVHRVDGPARQYELEVPGEARWRLSLRSGYRGGGRSWNSDGETLSPEERAWIKTQAESARTFIAALQQRWGALRRVGEYLLAAQADFWEGGLELLKPLTRREVALALGMHESTIGRAVAGKTIQLPGGRLLPLSDLFDPSLPAKAAILRLLAEHGARLNDRQIAAHLQQEGYSLARRTVAKYHRQVRQASQPHRFHL